VLHLREVDRGRNCAVAGHLAIVIDA
jgi:hypothetical protein